MGNIQRILLIEDDQNMRNAIRRTVRQALPSVDIVETGDGKQALSLAEKSIPGLVLLDVMMDGMNGLQVLKYLKKSDRPEVRKIPVIMLTGVGNREIATKSKKLGAVDYITKPFNEKILLMKIKNYLR